MKIPKIEAIERFGSSFIHVNSERNTTGHPDVKNPDLIQMYVDDEKVAVLVETLGNDNDRVARYDQTYYQLPKRMTSEQVQNFQRQTQYDEVRIIRLPEQIELPEMLELGQHFIGAEEYYDTPIGSHNARFQNLAVSHIWFTPTYTSEDSKLTLEPIYAFVDVRKLDQKGSLEDVSKESISRLVRNQAGYLSAQSVFTGRATIDNIITTVEEAQDFLKTIEDRAEAQAMKEFTTEFSVRRESFMKAAKTLETAHKTTSASVGTRRKDLRAPT